MKRIGSACAAALAYLGSGWGALSSIFLFLAAWELTAAHYGALVLPGPLAAFSMLEQLATEGVLGPELLATARRALAGFALSALAGGALGLVAGLSVTAAVAARPLVTLLVGMPPIAWLVLALLWFGAGDATPVFTVFIACFPVVFAGALQGTRTLDRQLKDVAQSYRLPWHMTLADVYLPHVLSYLFPAWVTALGMSWKIAVMAELLATPDGVGAALAVSRSHLDTAATLAWVAAVLGALLAVEYLLLEPIKRKMERWRDITS